MSKPAISFPNHIFRDNETAFSSEISVRLDFSGLFCTTVKDKQTSNQDCYMQRQNRMRTISSSSELFYPLILFLSDILFLCADFFLVEISVEPTLTPTLFLNDVTFLLLWDSLSEIPNVTGEFEQIQVERKKKVFGKIKVKK